MLGLLALLALGGCGGATPDESEEATTPPPVVVRIRQIYDSSEGSYVEGWQSFIRAERPNGDKVVETRLKDVRNLGAGRFLSSETLRLDPGR